MNRHRLHMVMAVFPTIILAILIARSVPVRATPTAYSPLLLQGTDATLRIVNESEQTICYVLLSPITTDEWGENWLRDDETIPPGETYSFDLSQGKYDVLLADCDAGVLLEDYGITLAEPYELRFSGPDPCQALNQEGMSLSRQARYPEALQQFQEGLSCYREVGDRTGEGVTLNNISVIYANLGQYEAALETYQQALVIHRDVGDQASEATTLSNIGVLYETQGDTLQAITHYQQAIEVVESIQGEIQVEELKASFAGEQAAIYAHLINLLWQEGRLEDVFNYAERAKPLDQQSQELLAQVSTNLEKARSDHEELLTRLKLASPEYASLVAVDALTLTQTQQLLTGTTLLEYYVLPEQIMAFVVTSDSFHVEPVSITQEVLSYEIGVFHSEARESLEGVPASMQRLYDILIAPIEADLNTEHLLVELSYSAMLQLLDPHDCVSLLFGRPDPLLAGSVADQSPHQGTLGQSSLVFGHLYHGGLFRRREHQSQSFRSVHLFFTSIPDDCARILYHIGWDSWGLLGTAPGLVAQKPANGVAG